MSQPRRPANSAVVASRSSSTSSTLSSTARWASRVTTPSRLRRRCSARSRALAAVMSRQTATMKRTPGVERVGDLLQLAPHLGGDTGVAVVQHPRPGPSAGVVELVAHLAERQFGERAGGDPDRVVGDALQRRGAVDADRVAHRRVGVEPVATGVVHRHERVGLLDHPLEAGSLVLQGAARGDVPPGVQPVGQHAALVVDRADRRLAQVRRPVGADHLQLPPGVPAAGEDLRVPAGQLRLARVGQQRLE